MSFANRWTILFAAVLLVSGGAQALWYEDVASDIGVVFQTAGEVHPSTIEDPFNLWPAFPELIGSGACWFDADGDGYDDLYLVNQAFNPENLEVAGWSTVPDARNALFINQGDGTFRDASSGSGADSPAHGNGCSAADYDGDGDVDLFVGNYGPDQLFANDGQGVFSDVSEASGVALPGDCGDWLCLTTSSAWADFDLDGDLDLYAGRFVNTNLTDTQVGPQGHTAQLNALYRNNGDGTLTNVAEAAGVAGNPTDLEGGKTLAVAWFDADVDGDMDLYAANDGVPNDFYLNQGDGTFVERSVEAGLADSRASMGVAVGDYDQDGLPDLFIPHYAQEQSGFYRNLGDGAFEDRSGEDGLGAEYDVVGWGARFTDLDRDGDLDLVSSNGWPEPHIPDPYTYGDPTKVYLNTPEAVPAGPGDRRWLDATLDVGPGAAAAKVSRGLAFSDYDLDGDMDMAIVGNANQTAQLLRASQVDGHWLLLELLDPGSMNPHAIGSRVTVEAGGAQQTFWVEAGSSYLSQNSRRIDVGLGETPVIDLLRIDWSGGGVTEVGPLAADQALRILPDGSVVIDVLAPTFGLVTTGTEGAANWWTSPVQVAVEAVDRSVGAPSGIALIEVDQGLGWESSDDSFTLLDGAYDLQVRVTDAAGNRAPTQRLALQVDTIAPQVVLTANGEAGQHGWWVGPVDLGAEASDGGSGLDRVELRINQEPWIPFEEGMDIDEDGRHEVQARAIDGAGNIGLSEPIEILIDRRPPALVWAQPMRGHVYLGNDDLGSLQWADHRRVLLLAAPPIPGHEAFRVEARAIDRASGVVSVSFEVDGSLLPSPLALGDSYQTSWSLGDLPWGAHELRVRAVDVAGHEAVRTLKVDHVGAIGGAAQTAGVASEGGSLLATLMPVGIVGAALATRRRPD